MYTQINLLCIIIDYGHRFQNFGFARPPILHNYFIQLFYDMYVATCIATYMIAFAIHFYLHITHYRCMELNALTCSLGLIIQRK